jgi:hypothetical protein
MLINAPLRWTDFSDEAVALNANGTLTPEQHERLVTAARAQYGTILTPRLQPLRIASLFTFVVLYFAQFFSLAVRNSDWLSPLMLLSLLVLAITFLYPYYQWQSSASRSLLHRLEMEDLETDSYVGPVRFDIVPSETGYRIMDTYWLVTDTQRFPVTREVWESLRPHADQIRLNYLTDPFIALLSVEAVTGPEPPTEAELATVTGIGDDGELIYEEQDEPRDRRGEM